MSELKTEIMNEIQKHSYSGWITDENDIEIATKRTGVVIVWTYGERFGEYDINIHRFTKIEIDLNYLKVTGLFKKGSKT